MMVWYKSVGSENNTHYTFTISIQKIHMLVINQAFLNAYANAMTCQTWRSHIFAGDTVSQTVPWSQLGHGCQPGCGVCGCDCRRAAAGCMEKGLENASENGPQTAIAPMCNISIFMLVRWLGLGDLLLDRCIFCSVVLSNAKPNVFEITLPILRREAMFAIEMCS